MYSTFNNGYVKYFSHYELLVVVPKIYIMQNTKSTSSSCLYLKKKIYVNESSIMKIDHYRYLPNCIIITLLHMKMNLLTYSNYPLISIMNL